MRIVILLMVFCLLPLSYAQDFENILQNADFEAGLAGWSMWVEDKGNALAVRDLEVKDPFEGQQSLTIDIQKAGNGKRVELHQNPLNLKKGQKLTYAFWAKADPGRAARMICNHREAPWTTYTATNINILDEWQEFWATFDMPDNDIKAGIYVELKDSIKGMVWFDRFRLYEGEYFPEDLGNGQPSLAVEPAGKLAVSWGGLKQALR